MNFILSSIAQLSCHDIGDLQSPTENCHPPNRSIL